MSTADPTPRVTIIILNWNGISDTLECLESVTELDYPEVKVIVVDNGSTDGSPSCIRQRYPSVTLLESKQNLGFTGGNNIGMRKALEMGTEYLWLLNNDTVVKRDTLKIMVDVVQRSPEVWLASPIIFFHDAPDQVQFRGSFIDWKKKRIVKLEDEESFPGHGENVSLWGTALLIRRTAVERVGYLNDKYFAYHEDEEYSMRVARAGYRAIVVPEARIFHKNSRTSGSIEAPVQVFLRSRNLFFLWMDKLKGADRISYFRRYLSYVISYGGALREKNLRDSVDACLDGVWHALRDLGGPRDPKISMPSFLRRIFLFLFTWHPFLWSSLLRGDFKAIGGNIMNRLAGPQIKA